MVKNILVGIGGSGAKGVESFIHLSAAGIGQDNTLIGLVDQDAANGNTNRAMKSAEIYRSLRRRLCSEDQAHALPKGLALFGTDITVPTEPVWCPLPGENKTLRKLFYYDMLRTELQGTMDSLFDPVQEQELPLERGFRGRPNIGAAVLTAQAHTQALHPLWQTIRDAIDNAKNGEEVRFFLIGSIFGGTGAAVFPTLAKLIRKLADAAQAGDKVKIGGALLMPYFQFPSDRGGEEGPAADSSSFVTQAKGALHYYPKLLDDVIDSLYLFGWDKLLSLPRRPSGGEEQCNPPLLPEVHAGLAAAHFFAAKTVQKGQVQRVDRGAGPISWSDLPAPGANRREVQEKLGQLTRFAVSYLGIYAPTLKQQIQPGMFAEAWLRHLIAAKNVILNDGTVQDLVTDTETYCTEFLRWIGGVVLAMRAASSDEIDLVDAGLFASWSPGAPDPVSVAVTTDKARRKDFATLVSGGTGPGLSDIYDRMGEAHKNKANPPTGIGLGVFLGRLYLESGFSGYNDAPKPAADIRLLPRLKDGANVPPAMPSGSWAAGGGGNLLISVAKGLDTPALNGTGALRALSVPDVWAQAVLFTDALSDSNHPLHKTTLAEWRGLLACIALIPEQLVTVTAEVFSPGAVAAQPFDGSVGRNSGESDFGTVINQTLPEETALGEVNWDQLAVIRMEGRPVGMIIPTFLVCSARAPVPSGTRLRWVTDGRFADPCTMPDELVSAEELLTISQYCTRILNIVRTAPPGKNELYNCLRGLLSTYIAESAAAAAQRARGGLGNIFDSHPVDLKTPRGMEFLSDSICRLRADETVPSDLRLVLSDTAKEVVADKPRNGVMAGGKDKFAAVLLDPKWSQAKRYSAERVWRMTAVEPLLADPALLARTKTEMADAGVLLVTPDLLFSPVLCELGTPILTHPEAFSKHLLPLTPLALTLFDIGDNRLSMVKSSGGFRVTLRLDVINRLGATSSITLEREYPQAMVIQKPELYRWPNKDFPGWPWHLVYAKYQKEIGIEVRDMVLPRTTLVAIVTEIEKSRRISRLEQLASTAANIADRFDKMSDNPRFTTLLFTLSEPVPAVAIDVRISRATPYPGVEDGLVGGGVILMPAIAKPDIQDRDWTVGIDFGTTNTSIYACQPTGDPKPLPLRCRVESPFPPPPRTGTVEEYTEFMPSNDLDIPFMTVMWGRTNPESQQKNRPILTYSLHNIASPVATLELLAGAASNLRFDLKWQPRNAQERDGIGDFLAAVILNVLVEGLNAGIEPDRIAWRFSFPQAFHGRKITSFKTTCQDAVDLVLGAFTPAIVQKLPRDAWKSEGETSALYFADKTGSQAGSGKKVSYNGTVITLDIGGHTSDITVWQKDWMLWRNSVELAGRHLLIDYLNHDPDLLEAVVRTDNVLTDAVTAIKQLSSRSKPAGFEVVVNSPGFDPFVKPLTRDEGLKIFVQLALGGLVYYVGLVLAHLHKIDKFEFQTGLPVTLCFAGKTSKLFTAMFRDIADETWIRTLLGASSGQVITSVRPVFSADPKHEVAYGLVVTMGRDGIRALKGIDSPNRDLVLGESLIVTAPKDKSAPPKIATLAATDADSESALPADHDWKLDPAMPEFEKFLREIRTNLRLRLKIGDHAMAEIRDAVDQELQTGRSERQALKEGDTAADTESTIMAPPFIVALRRLMELVAAKDHDITIEAS